MIADNMEFDCLSLSDQKYTEDVTEEVTTDLCQWWE